MELQCMNKECNWTWTYRGKKKYPAYVTCPNCLHKVKLPRLEGDKMPRPPAWSASEDARLIELRERGMTGHDLFIAFNAAFPSRSAEAVKQHIQMLRRDRRVR